MGEVEGRVITTMFEQELLEAFELADETMSLEETRNAELVQNLTDDSSFAIISTCRSEYSDSKIHTRTTELKQDARSLGYGFNEFVGRWVEKNEEGTTNALNEYSLLIQNISLKTACKLGAKYELSSIIYKDKDRIEEICTTPYTDWTGKERKQGDIVNTFHVDPEYPLNNEVASELFSRKKEGPTSRLLKGDNKKEFQLQEKYLVSTWDGFTYIPIKLTEDK